MAKKPARKSKRRAAASAASDKATTVAEVAAHFEVHPRTVKTWFSQGCPRQRGAYDLRAIAEWREENLDVGVDEHSEQRSFWRTRRDRADAQIRELELKQRSGQLIDVGQAARIVGQHVAEVKTHLNQLPNFAASLVKLKPAQKRDFLEAMAKKIRALCTGFEKSLTRLATAAAEVGAQATEGSD